MLTLQSLKNFRDSASQAVSRAEALAASRRTKINETMADKRLTAEGRFDKIGALLPGEDIRALVGQANAALDVIDEAKQGWRDRMAVLRNLARPTLGASAEDQMGWNNALAESAALGGNPRALQAELDQAIQARDWRQVYALVLGRVDTTGRPLEAQGNSAFVGVPLEGLPLPGIEEAEEGFLAGDLLRLRTKRLDLELSLGAQEGPRNPDGTLQSLSLDSQRIRTPQVYEADKDRRTRIQRGATALERWQILEAERKKRA